MFINCSNHRSSKWNEKQRNAALVDGEIFDFAFPSVSANEDELA